MASLTSVTVTEPHRVYRDNTRLLTEEQLRVRVNTHVNTHFEDRSLCHHTDPEACNDLHPSNEVMKKRIFATMQAREVTGANFTQEFARASAQATPLSQWTLPPDRQIAGFYITPTVQRAAKISAIGLVVIIGIALVLVAGNAVVLQYIT